MEKKTCIHSGTFAGKSETGGRAGKSKKDKAGGNMGNVFKEVKHSVTARAAAEHYGLKVNRHGMACCPFHYDKTPSLKVDDRYYCFGCGATGDVIDFTAQYFKLSNLEATKKLADDFGITYEEWRSQGNPDKKSTSKQKRQEDQEKQKQKAREQRLIRIQKEFDGWLTRAVSILIRYRKILLLWEQMFAPEKLEEEWHPLFLEALDKKTFVDAILDLLMFEGKEEQIEFYLYNRGEVERIERRMERYQRNIFTEIGRCDEYRTNDGRTGEDVSGYIR